MVPTGLKENTDSREPFIASSPWRGNSLNRLPSAIRQETPAGYRWKSPVIKVPEVPSTLGKGLTAKAIQERDDAHFLESGALEFLERDPHPRFRGECAPEIDEEQGSFR